jgi:nitroimidazol reductase NimA-like FMN-containing flavoprotein (pyridoxamine 5'-phosphate oxidase superfamily)
MSPMRRGEIRMSETQVDEFIHSQWCMVLGTHGPSGWPHLATLGYGFYEGKLAFSSFARAQKVVNIRRDPRINCLIEINQADYDNIAGVSILGHAELVDDPDAALAVARSVLAQRLKQASGGTKEEAAARHLEVSEALAAKRVAITVEVDRIVSWDHRHLGGRY